MNFRLLDCTLRDGSHMNKGVFGQKTITGSIKSLAEAGVDIIEVGFMWDSPQDVDTNRFYSMADVKRILPEDIGNSKISVMIEKQNLLDHIEDYDGSIEYIRVIFKRHLADWAVETVKELKKRGYKCFMNPVNSSVYSDEEYIELIKKVNSAKPYAMSIVDTFGVMREDELVRRYMLVENNLDKDITIGVHLHENLGLAYAMALKITEIADPKRQIVIDGSLLGMGRDPGNLKIEQIAEYMNYRFGTDYKLAPIYDAINEYIEPIKEKVNWGFALPYAMSAYYRLHRTYPEYLMGKTDLSYNGIDTILSKIELSEAEYYNEAYVEELYLKYKAGTL